MAKHSKVHFVHDDGMPACGKPMSRLSGGSALWQDVTCLLCKEAIAQAEKIEEGSKALLEAVGIKTVTLYTLAPPTLDRAGTIVGTSKWFYRDNNVGEQALREVVMPEEKYFAQRNAYTQKMPHITMTEIGLRKAIETGVVYKYNENGIAFDPIKAVLAIDKQANQKEVQAMPAKKKAASKTPQVPALADMTPLGRSEKAAPSALAAILAAPIVAAAVVEEENEPEPVDMAAEQEEKALARSLSMQPVGTMPVDYKTLAQEIIAALKADGLVMAHAGIMPPAVEPEPEKDPDIWDILGDGTGAPTPMVQPAKPRSIHTTKAAEKTLRASSGKTDPAIVKAIQTAWRSGKVTQADLALKYGMDDKKVWYFCNRAKQL